MSASTIPSFAVPVTASNTNYITDSYRVVDMESPVVFTSVDLDTDTLTREDHGYNNGDAVNLVDPGTTDLDTNSLMYVINADADTLQLSLVPGGTAIDLGGTDTTAPTLRISERLVTAKVQGCISVIGAGDVVVLPAGHADTDTATVAAGGAIKYTLAAGQFLPVLVKKVFATGTTATGIVCNYQQ